MPYLGTQPNDVKKNTGLYTPSDILELSKQGHWGGSLEFITEQIVTSMTSAIDFTSVFNDKYDVYFLETKKVQSSENGYTVGMQFYESGVLESAGVYFFALQGGRDNGTFGEGRSTTQTEIGIGADTNTDSGNSSNSYVYIYNPTNSSKYTFLSTMGSGKYDSVANFRFGGGSLPQASTVDGFRLKSTHSTGQITGEFTLYGVKNIWVT